MPPKKVNRMPLWLALITIIAGIILAICGLIPILEEIIDIVGEGILALIFMARGVKYSQNRGLIVNTIVTGVLGLIPEIGDFISMIIGVVIDVYLIRKQDKETNKRNRLEWEQQQAQEAQEQKDQARAYYERVQEEKQEERNVLKLNKKQERIEQQQEEAEAKAPEQGRRSQQNEEEEQPVAAQKTEQAKQELKKRDEQQKQQFQQQQQTQRQSQQEERSTNPKVRSKPSPMTPDQRGQFRTGSGKSKGAFRRVAENVIKDML